MGSAVATANGVLVAVFGKVAEANGVLLGDAVEVATTTGWVKFDGVGFSPPKMAIAIQTITNVTISFFMVFILLLLNSGSFLKGGVDS